MNLGEAVSMSTVSAFMGMLAALLLGIAIFVAQLRLAGIKFDKDRDKDKDNGMKHTNYVLICA